jgi:peptide/nickel transport system permease protein
MVAEASLSFLGFGTSGVASWGQLLEQGAVYFLRTPHLAVFPALAMMWAVLGFQLLGDALRDALDPRATP